jgi:hypothetical protein
MSGRYATNTGVSVEKSRGELETILRRYGATGFGYVTEGRLAAIQFSIHPEGQTARQVRFVMNLPDPDDGEFWITPGRGLRRDSATAAKLWEQACRTKWRALLLVVKAKLEAIEAEISTFDQEFLAHLLTGDGRTVYEHVREQIPALEAGGSMKLLPGGPA